MGFVMLSEENRAVRSWIRKDLTKGLLDLNFLGKPGTHDPGEGAPSAWSDGEIGFQHAGKFGDGLFVKSDGIQIRGGDTGLFQTEINGLFREAVVIFQTCEALFLSGSHDVALLEQDGCAVVIKGRDAQDMFHAPLHSG